MPSAVISDLAVQEALVGLLSLSGGYKVRVHLFTTNTPPDRTINDPAHYVEAAYPGYAVAMWTPTPIILDAGHKGNLQGFVASFIAPTSGSPVNVWGWWADYNSNTIGIPRILMSALFTGAPRVLAVGGPSLTFNLFLQDVDQNL